MRKGLNHLAASGASNGQVPVWDAASGEWKPGTASGGGGGSLTVQDENGNVGTSVTQIDFQGAGVTATAGTGEVVVTIPGGGGSGGWDNPVSLPLSTLTGWTAGSGSWAISSSVIRQSVANAASNRLRYTAAKIAGSEMVAEMDVKIDSAPSTSTSRAGFLFNYPPGSDTSGSVLVGFRCATTGFASQIYAEHEAVTAGPFLTMPTNIALGTWMTLRVHKIGTDFDVYVNATLVGSMHVNQPTMIDASTIALYSYNTDASFRNLDVWTPTLP